jgi:flagellar basal-body rod protein FlgF
LKRVGKEAMPYGLYISAEGALVQSRRLETVANNLANVNTVGFKRDLAIFQARQAEAITRGQAAAGQRTWNDLGGGVEVRETRTDYQQGPFKNTGIPTDMAIRGDGFFSVRAPDGDYLTRAGNFAVLPTGELVTQQGYSVLDEGGTPVLIESHPWELTHDGGIQQEDGTVIPLGLQRPNSLADMIKVGENLFRPMGRVTPVELEERNVVQGHLEVSGVNPTSEMMHMIEASRAFEANVNLIKNQDQMLGTMLGRLLKA